MKQRYFNPGEVCRLVSQDIDQYYVVKTAAGVELRYITPGGGVIASFGFVDPLVVSAVDFYPVSWSPVKSHFTFTPVTYPIIEFQN